MENKSKIGRPPLPAGERLKPRAIGVSDQDWQDWQDAAARAGEPLSAVIRRLMGRWVKRQEAE